MKLIRVLFMLVIVIGLVGVVSAQPAAAACVEGSQIRGAGGVLLVCRDTQWVPVSQASSGNWWARAYYGARTWAGQQYGTFNRNLNYAGYYGSCVANMNYRCFTH